jgi:hypothetical protein
MASDPYIKGERKGGSGVGEKKQKMRKTRKTRWVVATWKVKIA